MVNAAPVLYILYICKISSGELFFISHLGVVVLLVEARTGAFLYIVEVLLMANESMKMG